MVTITLLSFIACSGDKDDTAVETEDTSVTTEETDTEETDTEETDTEDPVEVAQVRVVHASPDAPNVDLYVNGEAAGINDLAFMATTGFVELPAGDYSFAVALTGTDFASAVPVTLDVTLGKIDVYTAIAHGYVDPSRLLCKQMVLQSLHSLEICLLHLTETSVYKLYTPLQLQTLLQK